MPPVPLYHSGGVHFFAGIFAAIGLTAYMMIGYRAAPPVVGYVAPDTPASRAGLLPGDQPAALKLRTRSVTSLGSGP